MPRARRSRVIDADRAPMSGAWSPTRTTCRAGGRASRAWRTCTSASAERARQWTKVFETTCRAKTSAPTSAACYSREPKRTAGSRRSRTRRSRSCCARRSRGIELSDADGGTRVDDRAGPAAARHVALRRVHAEARDRDAAGRGAGCAASRLFAGARPTSRRAMAEPAGADEVVGVGRPGATGWSCPPHALDALRAELGAPGGDAPPVALERRAPARAAAPDVKAAPKLWPPRWATNGCATTA